MSEIKPFAGEDDRVWLKDVIPLSTPYTLNIFPSNVCNFKCSYCAQSLPEDIWNEEYKVRKEMMQDDVIDLIVEQSKAFSDKYKLISMMGHGEPLCNRKLPEYIEKIKKADICKRIDIITNASLLTYEYSDEFIDAGLDVLRVSLQGITSKSYKNTSNVNIDFGRLYDNLTYFYKKSRGKCKLYVKTMDVTLSDNETSKFYELFNDITDRMYIDKVKPVYSQVEYTEEEKDMTTDRYGVRHSHRIVCPQPFYMMSVWPNGDVTACDALYKSGMLGNVKSESLRSMWTSDIHKAFCKDQLFGGRFTNARCKQCCAPDDVAHKEDVLDNSINLIIDRIEEKIDV